MIITKDYGVFKTPPPSTTPMLMVNLKRNKEVLGIGGIIQHMVFLLELINGIPGVTSPGYFELLYFFF